VYLRGDHIYSRKNCSWITEILLAADLKLKTRELRDGKHCFQILPTSVTSVDNVAETTLSVVGKCS
jgi:hypothetical protein